MREWSRAAAISAALVIGMLAVAGTASANHFETDAALGPRADLPPKPKELELPPPQDLTAACPDVTDCAVSVESMEVIPAEVDTSMAQQIVWVVAEVRDADPSTAIHQMTAGAVQGNAYAGSGSMGPVWVDEADPGHSFWLGYIVLPQSTPRGTWEISLDVFKLGGFPIGPAYFFSAAELREAGIANSFRQTGPGDAGPPGIRSLKITPRQVDTSAGPASVRIEVRAVDPGVGVSTIGASIQGPRPGAQIFAFGFRLEDGTAQRGTWVFDAQLPRYAAKGKWTIEQLWLMDRFESRYLDDEQLTALGFNPSFRQVGAGDTEPPELAGFSISPTEFDTQQTGYVQLDTEIHATDDLSGVYPFGTVLEIKPPEGGVGGGGYGIFNLSSGTPQDGVWSASGLPFPAPASPPPSHGIFELSVRLRDEAGNERVVTTEELAAAGFPSVLRNGP